MLVFGIDCIRHRHTNFVSFIFNKYLHLKNLNAELIFEFAMNYCARYCLIDMKNLYFMNENVIFTTKFLLNP